MNKLIVTQYTDPMCIWCYGLEPALRKLEFLNPDKVEFHNVMGLLVGDVKQIIGDDAFSQMKFAQLKTQMTEHFKDAANRSGMPVSTEHMKDKQPEDVTSLTMSLAFEAMKQFGEDRANKYLRRIREAAHADDMPATRKETLIDLAPELGVSKEEFRSAMDSKEAQDALEADMNICLEAGIRSFPTMKLEYNGKSKIVNGYMPYEQLRRVLEELCGDDLVLENDGMTPEGLATFVSTYKKVAAEEIKVAFSLNDAQLKSAVQMLLDSDLYTRQKRGSSYFILDKSSLVCDPETGTCHAQLGEAV